VLIVGGGISGLAMAIELRGSGLDVTVVEAHDSPSERYGETLAPGAAAGLARLGLAGDFASDGHLRCPGTVVRWGSDRTGLNDFVLDPRGPAWHIDRVRLEHMLARRAEALGATVLTGTRAVGLDPAADPDHGIFSVRISQGGAARVLRSVWLVDASGPTARFARRLGAHRRVSDRLAALIRLSQLGAADGPGPRTRPSAQTVLEATPYGWWYLARLPADRLVTVLVTDAGEVPALTADDWASWRQRLAETRLLTDRMSRCALGEERLRVRSVPVSALEPAAGERWLAVGDAAAGLDPLCGRGIHEALLGARDAAWVVAAALGQQQAPPWSYGDRVRDRFTAHLSERALWYGSERRWPGAPFWRGRLAPGP
jgi:flavin-dependent dehydrogenase